MLISKELLGSITDRFIGTLKEIENGILYYTYKECLGGCEIHGRINLCELMCEIKHWALDRDCTIMSFIDFDGTAFANVFCLLNHTKVSFQGNLEYEAVFKAGEIVLMESVNVK